MRFLFRLAFVPILLLFLLPRMAPAYATGEESSNEARAKLTEAFEAAAEAERVGGNVSSLVVELNEAVSLLESGEASGNETLISEAIMKAERVVDLAPQVGREGAAAAQARTYQTIAFVGVLIVLALVVWRYGPRLFWDLWIRSKRDWVVKT